jgi:quinol monooxygenase YgiN
MSGYVIMVDFRLKPGCQTAFRRLIDENARTSVREEPGCRRFDVLEPTREKDRIVLYEIYDDRAAFELHLKSAHFADFDSTSAPLVAEKIVTDYVLVCAGTQ